MELNAYEWYHGLLSMARLLSTEMKDEEKEAIKTFRDHALPMVQKNLKDSTNGLISIQPELYEILFDYEMTLRDILKTSGLQQKLKEFDPRKDPT